MTILYIFYALLLIGLLITVHEFGHFIAARLTGIAVKEFAIGFGPKLFQWKSKKHGTLFMLRAIPAGGYCMFYGDTDDDPQGLTQEDPRSYSNTAVWKRMLSVFCGPLMNFIAAFLVAILVQGFYGVMPTQPFIQAVEANSPAALGGIQEGDVFLRVNGQDMQDATPADIVQAFDALADSPSVSLTMLRNGEEVPLSVSPVFNEAANRKLMGIIISGLTKLSPDLILPSAWNTCVYDGTAILDSLGKLVTTGEGFDQTAGPVGMIQFVAEETRKGGLETFLSLLALLSINLGLLNLFPIPGLDGSRLVFMLIEGIRKKPISQRIEAYVHITGFALLIGLMLFFTFNDFSRIFGF